MAKNKRLDCSSKSGCKKSWCTMFWDSAAAFNLIEHFQVVFIDSVEHASRTCKDIIPGWEENPVISRRLFSFVINTHLVDDPTRHQCTVHAPTLQHLAVC